MVKTNYTKVEEALDKGLRRLNVEHLLDQANANKETQKNSPAEASQLARTQSQLITTLKRELKNLQKKDTALYTKLGIPKKELKHMIENPQALTSEQWELIKQIKIKIENFKADLAKKIPQVSNEALVDQERQKHVTKRFNINDKWLPLK